MNPETRLSCAANSFGSTGSDGPQNALLALLFVKAVFDLSLFSTGGAVETSLEFFGSTLITFCVGVFESWRARRLTLTCFDIPDDRAFNRSDIEETSLLHWSIISDVVERLREYSWIKFSNYDAVGQSEASILSINLKTCLVDIILLFTFCFSIGSHGAQRNIRCEIAYAFEIWTKVIQWLDVYWTCCLNRTSFIRTNNQYWTSIICFGFTLFAYWSVRLFSCAIYDS